MQLADRVIVMSARPAKIQRIVDIDIPHPRDISSPKYLGLRDGILDASPAPDGLQAQLYLRFRRIEHGNARTERGATSPGR